MHRFDLQNAIDGIQGDYTFMLMQQILESVYVNLYDYNELMFVAELYNLVSNENLMDSLDPKKNLMAYLKKEIIHDRFISIADAVHEQGFFFAKYDEINNKVFLVTSMENIANHTIELYFSDCKVDIRAVTPLNYKLLKEGHEPSHYYNPSVIFFRIIADAIEQKATDVHFLAYKLDESKTSFPVEYRTGNSLVPRSLFPIDARLNSEMIKEVITTRTSFQVTDIDVLAGVGASIHNPFYCFGNDLRVNVTKTVSGYTYTIRIMGAGDLVTDIENLGFKPKVNSVLDRVTRSSNGLTLVTGPQRSGKNTTLFAILNKMIARPIKIVDYSSPVETLLPIIQVDYKGNPDYLDSLVKSCKKHDVDVALINELPNKDIADSVYDLVNSSVGVMTTFHINRIWHLCYKLKEYFGDNIYNLFTNINYVFNQKIFIKQCPHCQETYQLDKHSGLYPEVLELAEKYNVTSYKESKGCEKCKHTGVVSGIQPYVEYLIFDEDFRTKLFNCSTLYEMELLIKDKVRKENTCLEHFVLEDINAGILHPNQLTTLL